MCPSWEHDSSCEKSGCDVDREQQGAQSLKNMVTSEETLTTTPKVHFCEKHPNTQLEILLHVVSTTATTKDHGYYQNIRVSVGLFFIQTSVCFLRVHMSLITAG